jgi:hypothetical protein
MNWTKVTDELPPKEYEEFSIDVIVWYGEGWTKASYNFESEEWRDDEWEKILGVTHWALVIGPEEDNASTKRQ